MVFEGNELKSVRIPVLLYSGNRFTFQKQRNNIIISEKYAQRDFYSITNNSGKQLFFIWHLTVLNMRPPFSKLLLPFSLCIFSSLSERDGNIKLSLLLHSPVPCPEQTDYLCFISVASCRKLRFHWCPNNPHRGRNVHCRDPSKL